MIINKKIATSLTSLVFLVIAVTGVLMYFHLFDKYTKSLHEIIGLVFVVFALFHVMFNFKAMKSYFKLKTFFISAAIVLIFSVVTITTTMKEGGAKGKVFDAMFQSDVNKVLVLFSDDYTEAKKKLEENGIFIGDAKNLDEVASNNSIHPFMIIDILSK